MAYCLSAVIFTRTEVINGFAQWVNPFRNYVYSGALRSQILPENEMGHQTADKDMWIISRCSVKEKARRIQSSLQVTNNYSLKNAGVVACTEDDQCTNCIYHELKFSLTEMALE